MSKKNISINSNNKLFRKLLCPTLLYILALISLFLLFSTTHILFAKTESQISEQSSDPLLQIEKRVVKFTLNNGMRVLLVKNGHAPVFSAYIRFKVGGADEDPNYTGMAHLFEHMAFKGTPVIGTKNYRAEKKVMRKIEKLGEELSKEYAKGEKADLDKITKLRDWIFELQKEQDTYIRKNEFWKILEENGGADLNASTSKDTTNYYVSLPTNKLELWAFMESERLKNPVMREFYQERDVIVEERRMSVETNPFGFLYEKFLKAAFTTSPYRWPTLGWMNHINTITIGQAIQFYKHYYVPENAVMAIVGDIDIPYTKKIIKHYFGKLKKRPAPPDVVSLDEPSQEGENRIDASFPAEPSIIMGYKKPPMPTMDDSVFDVIAAVLGEGRTSRLYRSLVEKKRITSSVVAYNGSPGQRGTNLFIIIASPLFPHSTTELEKAIDEEIKSIRTEPVTKEELEKIRRTLDKEIIWSLKTNDSLASSLSYFELLAGDWRYIINNRKRIDEITPEQIMEVAKKYLVKTNRTVATLVKEKR